MNACWIKTGLIVPLLIVAFTTANAQTQCPTCTKCKGEKYVRVESQRLIKGPAIRDPQTREIIDVGFIENDCYPGPCAEVCSLCDGKGRYCPPTPPDPCKCTSCGGDGKVTHRIINSSSTTELRCQICSGDGNTCN